MEEEDEIREIKKLDYDAEFLKFVEDKINYYVAQDRLGNESDLSFDALYTTLKKYQQTYWSILAIYEKANNELKQKTTQFQLWWDEKFVAVRSRENRVDLSAQKWASKAELESMTRVENKADFLKWEEEMRLYEGRASFVKRILDQWLAQNHTLGHLTNLMKTDIATTNISNRLN